MLRRILLTAALAMSIAGVLLVPSPAGAQSYGGCAATVSDTTPTAGQTVTVTGSGAANNGPVSASVSGTTVGSGTATSTGTFSFSATIPTSASGTVTLSVSCGGAEVDALTLTVAAGSIARTGASSTLPLTLAAFGALGVGAAVLTIARRRMQEASSSAS